MCSIQAYKAHKQEWTIHSSGANRNTVVRPIHPRSLVGGRMYWVENLSVAADTSKIIVQCFSYSIASFVPLVFNTQPTKSGLHTFPLRRQIACQPASGCNYSIFIYFCSRPYLCIAATTLVSKVHKQGASSNSQAYTSVTALHVKQPSRFFSICCNLELISISYNYHAATDVGMLGNSKMPLVCALCLPSVVAAIVHSCLCALQGRI